MVILVKRAKIFIDDSAGKHRRIAVALKPTGQQVPDWVKGTSGYAAGIKDGSIIDLTPPAPVAVVEEEVKAEEQELEEKEVEEETEAEQNAKALQARKPKGNISAATVKAK